jgi:uncharacterized protein YdeI (YjbR/CyaY-like superfamily)
MNRTSVDAYLRDGCGRCDKYQTPACKVHRWTTLLVELRALVRASGLVEEMKWGSPCYTLDGRNVVMLVAFKDACALQFMEGAALVDDEGLLEAPGPNSRVVRSLRFRSAEEFEARKDLAARLLAQARVRAHSGTKLTVEPADDPVPVELERRLASDPALSSAFEALTPGRRRSYILHIAGAKQSETRERRVDRCVPEIVAGRGFHER